MRQVPTAPAAGKSGLCSAISGPARSTPLQLLRSRAPLLRSGASGCSRAGPYCRTESVRIFRADSRGPPRKGAMRQVPTAPAAGKSGLCSAISGPARSTPPSASAAGAAPEERRIRLQSSGPILPNRVGPDFRATAAGHRERAPMRQVPTAPAAGKSGLCSAISGPARSTPLSASAGRRS